MFLNERLRIAKRFQENFKETNEEYQVDSFGEWEVISDNVLSTSFQEVDDEEVTSINLVFERDSYKVISANINGCDDLDVAQFNELYEH